ncbi:MAG TPA: chromosome segregation protein SMC [Actinomycetota bacterium]|nr:chromosome segregation protein SMC [Actinomycetota bacterium]
MFLRSLTIRGFKSFADKTVLEFTPGIAAVVGPNGAGKSNLVDAISWVLGEQGPGALRGGQMADVIFAGSPGRAPLGIAEVSLVIDNSQGLIPVPLSEIEIARVVYRSGESQYLIGGHPVRLMDIQELLSDTGIGRAMHTVVGQGHLEDVLITRPEERRQFIEEAAGIAKHRRRKDRAQRKLVSLEQDLLRLQDVMAELRRQLKPLKQQAKLALRHQELTEEAEGLGWRLAATRLRDLYRARDQRRSLWEKGRAHRQEAEKRLSALDTEIAALAARRAETEQALLDAEGEEARSVRARSEAEAALREAVRAEGEARASLAADAGRSGRLFTFEEEMRTLHESVEATDRALEEKERALAEAELIHERAEAARREAEQEHRKAHEAAASRRAEREHVLRSLKSFEAEHDRLASALQELSRRAAEATGERDRLEAEVERLDAEETPLAERQAEGRRILERLETETADLETRERRLDARLQGLLARQEALAATPGRRFAKRIRGRAIGLLSDQMRIDRGMEAAVAAGLGSWADAVVYLDHGEAVADAGGAAGVTLAIPGSPERTADELPGERSLLAAVRADPPVQGLLAEILRGVYLASDSNEALAKHARYRDASFVTPDGVLVGPALVRVAPRPSAEQEAIRRERVVVEREVRVVRRELQEKRRELDRVGADLTEVAEGLDRADAKITAAAEVMTRVGAELAAIEREREMLAERQSRVEEGLADARDALARMSPDAAELPSIPAQPDPPFELRVEVEALRRERARLESGLEKARAGAQRVGSEDPASLQAAADRAATARVAAEAALRDAETEATEASRRREATARVAGEVRSAETKANEAWREAAALLQRLRDQYEEEDQIRRDIERRIVDAERVLREGHSRDPDEAVGSLEEEDTVESLERRGDLVARRLTLLGRVNLVAGEEYQSLQERHDFLQREIDDVRAARGSLMDVVRQVDRKIVEIFDAAFRDVEAEFSELFKSLFPGGEGKLVLTDPGNLLTTGIEIEARPGRKRFKRLSLLSGGERALTAVAFLFAIFRARPSPFYLLDEVEAALDDVNLHRFLDLVRHFSRTSQVLLVTHQKRTMEAADVLYGVSMGKGGASAVICQRMPESVAVGPATADR